MTDIFFIAPRSGILGITPTDAAKYRNPLPSDAYLIIQFADTMYTPHLLPFLPYHYVGPGWQDSCGTGIDQVKYGYSGSPSWYVGSDTFYTGPVQIGDTVRFAFQGQYYNPTDFIQSQPEYGRWLVYLRTPLGCYDPSEFCELLFFFADTLVKITRPDSVNVYPTYANHNDSPARKNYMDLQLRVEFGDSTLRNYSVQLDAPTLMDSGGHSHDGARPSGRYIVPKATEVGVDTIASGIRETDSTGVLRFKFLASQLGGKERIKARIVSYSTKFDTLSLVTRVPGLDSLGPGNYYELVGTPDNHSGTNDPCRPVAPISQHYKNHYGTSRLRQAVREIAAAYDSLYHRTKLRINDMSLVAGGLFDANHNATPLKPWMPPHREHRIGINADIGFSGIDSLGQCVDPLDTVKVHAIIEHKTGIEPLVEGDPPHYHIYVKED